ncbi:MAG: hypothetical protein HY791_04350 [Deltaproteobacteria bacterium]|nr:hypothetical protein [Deltaproteobacteria bacterium]
MNPNSATPEDVLASLGSKRPDGCPKDAALIAFDVGEAPGSERSAIATHLESCKHCQAFIAEMHGSFDSLPPAFLTGVVGAMHIASAREPSTRARSTHWLGLFGLAALAASLLLFVKPPQGPSTISKGGLELVVYRDRGGSVMAVSSGESFSAGDRLRFSVDLPKAAFVAIVGVESSGRKYPAFPSRGGLAQRLEAGSAQLLADAIALDASTGEEALHLIACESTFEVISVDPMSPGPGCVVRTFVLDKRPSVAGDGGP